MKVKTVSRALILQDKDKQALYKKGKVFLDIPNLPLRRKDIQLFLNPGDGTNLCLCWVYEEFIHEEFVGDKEENITLMLIRDGYQWDVHDFPQGMINWGRSFGDIVSIYQIKPICYNILELIDFCTQLKNKYLLKSANTFSHKLLDMDEAGKLENLTQHALTNGEDHQLTFIKLGMERGLIRASENQVMYNFLESDPNLVNFDGEGKKFIRDWEEYKEYLDRNLIKEIKGITKEDTIGGLPIAKNMGFA